MKNFVDNVIKKLDSKVESESYDIERLKKSCVETSIPKEFFIENIDDIKDELKAFTLGCELFKDKVKKPYEGNVLETTTEVKEAGVYQFLEATLQNEVASIIGDASYLKRLLALNKKDIKEFGKTYSNDDFTMEIDSYSTVGLVRDVNQDNFRIYQKDELLILIVADGVGGGEDGDVASELACMASLKYLEQKNYNVSDNHVENYLTEAIMESHNNVLKYAKSKEIETIGTTLSIALIYKRKLFVGHVGDSRIYRIREQDVSSITKDHSLPEVLYEKGEISKEEKENYKKNILVYVVGKKGLKRENLQVFTVKKRLENEKLFLCSDGVWDIDNDRVESDSIEKKFGKDVKELNKFIMQSVPRDNATFIGCRFKAKNNINSQNVHINFIEMDKREPTLLHRFLPIILVFMLLGISYFVYDLVTASPLKSDVNQTDEINITEEVNSTKESPSPVIIDKREERIQEPSSNNKNIDKKIIDNKTVAREEIAPPKRLSVKGDTTTTSSSSSISSTTPTTPKVALQSPPVETPTLTSSSTSTSTVVKKTVPKINVILDTTSYDDSDILIMDDMKIFFSENKIMSTESCFGTLINTNKTILRCKIKKQIVNPELLEQLVKQKFAKTIEIGWHPKIQESHIVVKLNSDYTFVEIKKVIAPDHVEDIVFKKTIEEPIKQKVELIQPEVKHWSDSDALYLDDVLITFKRDKITLTGKGSSCHQEGNKWVCLVVNKRVNYENITDKLKKQEFADIIELSSYNSNENTRILITLKENYAVSSNKTVNKNCVLSFYKK